MKQISVEELREFTRGCSVVLLTATAAEAEPLRVALAGTREVVVCAKTVLLGELEAATSLAADAAMTPCGRRIPSVVPVVLAVGGCDKANTAHMLTCLLEAMRPGPSLVVQVGVAGAFRAPAGADGKAAGAVLHVGDLVLATQEAYSDTGSSSPEGWISAADLGLPIAQVAGVELGGVFPLDASLVEAARAAVASLDWPGSLTVVHAGPCVTSSQATGRQAEADAIYERWGALAESMEGAAAAHMCALYGVPFLEIRGISNLVGDRDRAAWQVERAVAWRDGRLQWRALAGLPLTASDDESAGRGGPPVLCGSPIRPVPTTPSSSTLGCRGWSPGRPPWRSGWRTSTRSTGWPLHGLGRRDQGLVPRLRPSAGEVRAPAFRRSDGAGVRPAGGGAQRLRLAAGALGAAGGRALPTSWPAPGWPSPGS